MRHAQKRFASAGILLLNLECYKCARMRFHCANGLVFLCSWSPQMEHCTPSSRPTDRCFMLRAVLFHAQNQRQSFRGTLS